MSDFMLNAIVCGDRIDCWDSSPEQIYLNDYSHVLSVSKGFTNLSLCNIFFFKWAVMCYQNIPDQKLLKFAAFEQNGIGATYL